MRRLMIRIRFIFMLFCMSSAWAGSVSESSIEKPNVVIIFTDDQGYQDLGCYGSPDIRTPHLDQLAEEGMRFTDFYVVASVCSPSRAGLLTGRYPVRMGLANSVLFPHSGDHGLPPKEQTLAELMKGAGYRTACVGKWHLGHQKKYLPTAHGFDSFFGIPFSNDMWMAPELEAAPELLLREGVTQRQLVELRKLSLSKWDATNKPYHNWVPLMRNTQMIEFPVDQSTLTKRLTDEAIRFIETSGEEPFFLYLAHPMPHIPLHVSEAFAGRSKAGLYGDVIEELDASTGRVLAALERGGVAKNTLVIFTSDNGPWLKFGDLGGRAHPLKGGKGSVFEGGVRVPCVIRWPNRIQSGQTCTAVASTLDIFPFIAELFDHEPEQVLDGVSLAPLVFGERDHLHESYIYYGFDGKAAAIRMGDWKLIYNVPVNASFNAEMGWNYTPETMQPELYNLRNDPGEKVNIAEQFPTRVVKMKKQASKRTARIEQD
jgi:arylsulfatase A